MKLNIKEVKDSKVLYDENWHDVLAVFKSDVVDCIYERQHDPLIIEFAKFYNVKVSPTDSFTMNLIVAGTLLSREDIKKLEEVVIPSLQKRNIRRLITVFDLLNKLWIKWSYDLRFFQFIELLRQRIYVISNNVDFFSMEDDLLIEYLQKLLEETC